MCIYDAQEYLQNMGHQTYHSIVFALRCVVFQNDKSEFQSIWRFFIGSVDCCNEIQTPSSETVNLTVLIRTLSGLTALLKFYCVLYFIFSGFGVPFVNFFLWWWLRSNLTYSFHRFSFSSTQTNMSLLEFFKMYLRFLCYLPVSYLIL